MKPTKELLQLLLDNIEYLTHGLCNLATDLYLKDKMNKLELSLISFYIMSHRPSCLSSLEAFRKSNSGFFWDIGNKKPRIKWLKYHIKKLS